MLIGRQNELNILNQLYHDAVFSCVVLHGRPRVGKTALIHAFCKDKKSLYFAASDTSFRNNLHYWEKRAYPVLAPEQAGCCDRLNDMPALLDFLCESTKNEPCVVVFDGLQPLFNSDRSLLESLGNYLNGRLKDTQCFLILCESSATWLNRQVFSPKSPMHGGINLSLHLKPLDYYDSAYFLPGLSASDKLLLYGITGGIPAYLAAIDLSKNLRENMISLFFTPNGALTEEPLRLLKNEFHEPGAYTMLLEAVAAKEATLPEIAAATQQNIKTCAAYLKPLILLSLLTLDEPLTTNSPANKKYYSIDDTLFLFWLRFVIGHRSAILAGEGTLLFESEVFPALHPYAQTVFARMAAQYLQRKNLQKELPFPITVQGRWWKQHPSEEDIFEAAALNVASNQLLLGKCRYTNGHTGMEYFVRMLESASSLSQYPLHFAIFSKSGFTRQLLDTEGITLVDLNTLFQG